jgi:hypothetical protein
MNFCCADLNTSGALGASENGQLDGRPGSNGGSFARMKQRERKRLSALLIYGGLKTPPFHLENVSPMMQQRRAGSG